MSANLLACPTPESKRMTDETPDGRDDLRAIRDAAFFAATQTGMFPSPRSSLFRYVGMRSQESWQFLEKTILESKLSLTTPDRFNDPFDSDPCYVNDVSIEELMRRATIQDTQGNVVKWTETTQIHGPKGTLSKPEMEHLVRQVVEAETKRVNRRRFIASFCRRISSQLLWAHYAASYRGIAYHFVARGPTMSPISDVRPVRYERQRPIILLSEILDRFDPPPQAEITQQHLSFYRRAYLTKSIEWSYEEEERLINDQAEVVFDPRELASVIVGPRCSPEDVARLEEIVSRRSRALPIYRAKVAESDYAIEVEWSKSLV